jgi:RimJ/RimL family protein N-acetyltransferase
MLASLLEWAHADGRVGKVELNVRASNAEAIRLYLRHGFEQEGRLRRRVKLPDGSLVDDLVMGLGIGVVP